MLHGRRSNGHRSSFGQGESGGGNRGRGNGGLQRRGCRWRSQGLQPRTGRGSGRSRRGGRLQRRGHSRHARGLRRCGRNGGTAGRRRGNRLRGKLEGRKFDRSGGRGIGVAHGIKCWVDGYSFCDGEMSMTAGRQRHGATPMASANSLKKREESWGPGEASG